MAKLTIMEAVKVVPVSESTLRRDLKTGKVSFSTAKNGGKVIDTSELERVYGIETVNDSQNNGNDSRIISLLETQVQDLKSQLDNATTEKTELLSLLKELQIEKRALMPPQAEQVQETEIKPRGWFQRLIGIG